MSKTLSIVGDALVFLANALRADDVAQLKFDPLHAKSVCVAGLTFLANHRQQLEKDLPNLDLTELDVLPELCDRIVRVQREVDNFRRDKNPAQVVVRSAIEWRRKLRCLAKTLVTSGALEASAVERVHTGRARKDRVQDLVDLILVLEPHRAMVETMFGADALQNARASADAAIKVIGRDSQPMLDAQASADLRDRYATLVVQRHDRLRAIVGLVSSTKLAATIVGPLRKTSRHRAAPEPT